MKKALVILLALTMVMSMFAMVPASAADEELAVGQVAADYKPEGTAINNAAEFAAMDPAGTYYLAADITIDETYALDFTGTFDGNGKSITTSVPVFAEFDGVLKNLTTKGAVNIEGEKEGTYEVNRGVVANIVGHYADTEITNVCNMAPITSATLGIGGVVGYVSNDEQFKVTFTNVVNYGNITASNTSSSMDCAGIAAQFDGDNGVEDYYVKFIDCANYGIVNACGRPGGIMGYANASTAFINCVNEGEIQSTANYCGGIAGRLDGDSGANYFLLENCVNRGKVIVWKSQGGGMVGYCGGYSELIYKNCTNYGDVVGHPDNPVGVVLGGFHGNNNKAAIDTYFINCVNYGNIGLANQPSGITAGGIAGGVRGKTSGTISFQNCYNYGTMYGTNRAAGIAGGAPWSDNAAKVTEIISCGNFGDITCTGQAAGLLAYSYGSWTGGPSVKYSFTIGDVTGGTFTAGLIGYMNSGYEAADIEYNFIAGEYKGMTAKTVTVADGDTVAAQTMYTFNYDGTDYYFYAPEAGTVAITGNKVVFTANTAIAPQVITDGAASAAKNGLVMFEHNGKNYIAVASGAKGSTITIDTENLKVITNDTPVKAVEFPAGFDGKTLELQVFDHNIGSAAIVWNNKATIEIDMTKNIVAEGTTDVVAIQGAGNAWLSVNTTEIANRTPLADFANGTVAYELNEMIGETVFYQNINSDLFVVDAFPTTDATHAKVVMVGGVIGNQLFDLNNDSGSPATGDAIVYVVVALAVSTISLAAVAVCKKIKEN